MVNGNNKSYSNLIVGKLGINFTAYEKIHAFMRADLRTRKEHVLKYTKDKIDRKGSLASDAIKYVYADTNCTLMVFT